MINPKHASILSFRTTASYNLLSVILHAHSYYKIPLPLLLRNENMGDVILSFYDLIIQYNQRKYKMIPAVEMQLVIKCILR
jgi:hypothetical protein